MEPSKPIHKSKTIWFNILLPVAAYGLHMAAQALTGVAIPPEVTAGALAGVQSLGNVILRLLTKQPIE